MSGNIHLHDELSQSSVRVAINTRYGDIIGGRAKNGAAVFLEIPYALTPGRFEDPKGLPKDYRYEAKECITESTYAAQPRNDGQQGDTLFEDKVGFGQPSENPLFVNIVTPPSFPAQSGFPVKVYIHGGFLQFGSPHGLSSQAQYIAAERSEVWVNIGYRLSAFGFLACDKPRLDGNYGFKDQWLALEWVKANIDAFGGNPDDIQICGLSAGAHSVHTLLHYASRLPTGEKAPFQSAILQSNAIVTDPKTRAELRDQFYALCRALNQDPDDPDILSTLRDPSKVSSASICQAIETDALGTKYGTFRACLDGSWLSGSPDLMTWQRSGGFARGLRASGVRSIVVGDLTEEWYLYSIAHPITSHEDIDPNLERYYRTDLVKEMRKFYDPLWNPFLEGSGSDALQRHFGEILCDWQVHLPVRILARDLHAAGFPCLRYEIRWTPEQNRAGGYVTHGSDRSLWAFRTPILEHEQIQIARVWLSRVSSELQEIETEGNPLRSEKEILALDEDTKIRWVEDPRWEEKMRLFVALSGK